MKIVTVFGTRPEAIKMCPLVLELKKHNSIQCIVCLTGQHRQMLHQIMEVFGIQADYDLDIMSSRQTLTTITTSILEKIEPILKNEKPDIVLVHGDTTTSYAAALASFYQQIPVGHVEAGLRTGDIYSPFPEEMNRLLTDRIASYYFAPTEQNRMNLQKEGITENVYVTGNTVIDSFAYTVKEDYTFHNQCLVDLYSSHNISDCRSDGKSENGGSSGRGENGRTVLITAHRRENLGKPLAGICRAIKRLAIEYPTVNYIYPVHLNPAVQETVHDILDNIDNVFLIEPIDVPDMHNLIARCYMVMTDSGGLQEEAPSFGKPVLVLRTETERPEAVEAGTVKVVGIDEDAIVREVKMLLDDPDTYSRMAQAVNPYGDGHSCERITKALLDIETNMTIH